jgi:hypothetical protein
VPYIFWQASHLELVREVPLGWSRETFPHNVAWRQVKILSPKP